MLPSNAKISWATLIWSLSHWLSLAGSFLPIFRKGISHQVLGISVAFSQMPPLYVLWSSAVDQFNRADLSNEHAVCGWYPFPGSHSAAVNVFVMSTSICETHPLLFPFFILPPCAYTLDQTISLISLGMAFLLFDCGIHLLHGYPILSLWFNQDSLTAMTTD